MHGGIDNVALVPKAAAGDGRQVLSRPGSPSHSSSNQDQNQPPQGIEDSQRPGRLDPLLGMFMKKLLVF